MKATALVLFGGLVLSAPQASAQDRLVAGQTITRELAAGATHRTHSP